MSGDIDNFKKIDICEYQYTSDAIGNRVKTLVTVATVWAYFRQLSMKEFYGVTTQVQEEVLFQIGYRTDITTANVIALRGVNYEIPLKRQPLNNRQVKHIRQACVTNSKYLFFDLIRHNRRLSFIF